MGEQQKQKKQLERLLVDFFQDSYARFPKGKLSESESPDFQLQVKSKYTIGIELTRLYPKSQKEISPSKQVQLDLREVLIQNTRQLFEEKSQRFLFVKFLFDEAVPVTEERILSMSVRLARIIHAEVQDASLVVHSRILINRNLPVGIDSILVLLHPGLNFSVWEQSNNLGISENLAGDIRYSIFKKDEKLKLYLKKQLNEYWLLITTDKLRQAKQVNIPNLLQNQDFYSEFRNVCILELFSGKVYQLI